MLHHKVQARKKDVTRERIGGVAVDDGHAVLFLCCRRLRPPVARPALNDTSSPIGNHTHHGAVQRACPPPLSPAAEPALPTNRARCVIPTAGRKVQAPKLRWQTGRLAERAKKARQTPEVRIRTSAAIPISHAQHIPGQARPLVGRVDFV